MEEVLNEVNASICIQDSASFDTLYTSQNFDSPPSNHLSKLVSMARHLKLGDVSEIITFGPNSVELTKLANEYIVTADAPHLIDAFLAHEVANSVLQPSQPSE